MYIEAAIVIPIVLITMLSSVVLGIYEYRCLKRQCDIQLDVLEEADASESLFSKKRRRDVVINEHIGFMYGTENGKAIYAEYSAMNPCLMVRLGRNYDEEGE